MNGFIYLVQFNLYLTLYFFLYQLFRKDTFFTFHRWFLLGGVACSALLPFVHLSPGWVPPAGQLASTHFVASLKEVAVSSVAAPVKDHASWSLLRIMLVLYFSGVAVFLMRLAFRLSKIYHVLRRYPHERMGAHYHVVTEQDSPAFSFGRCLFAPADVSPAILAHETVHLRQHHSIDNLLMEIVKIFCWFNPVVYAHQRALKTVHEYIADALAVRGCDKYAYAHLLASRYFDLSEPAIPHTFFNHSQLKNRLIMLQKNKSRKTAIWKYALSLPLFALLLGASSSAFALRDKVQNGLERLNALPRDVSISGRVVDEQGKGLAGVSVLIVGSQEGTATGVDGSFSLHNVPENALLQLSIIGYARQTISVEGRTKFSIAMSRKPANIEKVIVVGYADQSAAKDSLKALPDRSRVFMSVEKMPQFPGGHTALMKYLHDHIRYPQEARKQHVQGTVVVSFVVNADGSIRDISTHNRTLGSGLEEEAIRIVKGMPHWQPGQQNGRPVAVEYNMPIQFVLE